MLRRPGKEGREVAGLREGKMRSAVRQRWEVYVWCVKKRRGCNGMDEGRGGRCAGRRWWGRR